MLDVYGKTCIFNNGCPSGTSFSSDGKSCIGSGESGCPENYVLDEQGKSCIPFKWYRIYQLNLWFISIWKFICKETFKLFINNSGINNITLIKH